MAANLLGRVYISTFALMKDIIVGQTAGKNKKSVDVFTKILALIMATVFLLSIALIVIPCAIFRAFLYVWLKLTYWNQFGGFLNGMDNLFEMNPESVTINATIIYRFNGTYEEHLKMLRKYTESLHTAMYKFSSAIENCCGFLYFVKDRVIVDDVLNYVELESKDGYLTRDMLCDYIEENCSAIVENQMWKVAGFVQPIHWEDKIEASSVKRYPITFSIKHCIGDGPSIIGTMKKLFVKALNQTKHMQVKLKTSKPSGLDLDSVYVHRNPLTTKLEGDILKVEGYNRWHLAMRIENNTTYLPMIKKIKDKLNVRLMDVINAAVCSSILDYIVQRNVEASNVTACAVARVHSEDLPQIVSGQYDFQKLANNSSVLCYHIPFTHGERSMKTKILTTHNTNQSLIGAVDVFLSYAFLRVICSYIPIILMRHVCKKAYEGATVLISNLVGTQRSACMGCEIEDAFFCVPNMLDLGFMFTIFTYDGRLEVAVSSKRGYVHNRQELQRILDNVFKHLDQAEKEILSGDNEDMVSKKRV